jgi:predicted DsbA family dithiol-disulfide isomerase
MSYAKDLKLNVTRFQADMKTCVPIVNDDDKNAGTWQVHATPAFFINGRYLVGGQPIENFARVIDEELAKANDRIKQGTPKARYFKTWVIDKGEKKVTTN